MNRKEWNEMDDYGKALFAYFVACDHFRSDHGRMPSHDELPLPKHGDVYLGDMPRLDGIQPFKPKNGADTRKKNKTPGVTFERYRRNGKLQQYWTATFTYDRVKRTKRCHTRYEACVARNAFVLEYHGDTRPDLMIDLTTVEELKAS